MSDFTLFGQSHLVVLLLLLTGSLFILITKNKVLKNIQKDILGYGLLLQIIVFHGYHIIIKDYSISSYLPFHLCSLSAVIVCLSVITENKRLSTLALFWAPVSAMIAILLPDMGRGENFPAFRFIEFFWSHLFIVWGCFWILSVAKVKLNWKSLFYSYFALLLILPLIAAINLVTNGNYMYLMSKPAGGQMNFLPDAPYHVLGLVGLVFVAFVFELYFERFLNLVKKGLNKVFDI